MEMNWENLAESLFRWVHVVAGILWIGLLFFFNWVNTALQPVLDAETKRKVNPELLPRTLFWFRWGAAYTWVTGMILLIYIFYYQKVAMVNWTVSSTIGALILVGGLLVATLIYDLLCKTVLKNNQAMFFGGLILASAVPILLDNLLNFSQRGYTIHLGAMLGTFMAFNVWMRIWPAQQKVIAAVKAGEKPPADLAALAGTRSKHNTYMSVPLVFTMINAHTVWIAPAKSGTWGIEDAYLPLVILIGWGVTYLLYQKAKKVPGF